MTSRPTPEPLHRPTNASSASPASRPVPESLLSPGLGKVWAAARQRLDRFGPQRRGAIARPLLDPASSLAIESLLGRKPAMRLELEQMEAALVARGIGADLCDALTRLGHPPSEAATHRRIARARSEAARAELRQSVAGWNEPWAKAWADEIIGAGLLGGHDGHDVKNLISSVRHLLDRLEHVGPAETSRTELAATLFGSAHALDMGTKLASVTTRALRHRLSHAAECERQSEQGGQGGSPIDSSNNRELWEASGILADRVSAPVLCWSVPAMGSSVLDQQIHAATRGALPLHITLVALQKHAVCVPANTPVLVVENPRLVEAAAERNLAACVVSTNGNPTTAVTTLLRQLDESGASIWYHGDFDSPGIAICRRMHEFGCTPWMMDAFEYKDAIRRADEIGGQLERDAEDCGPTPWDPMLETEFDNHRLIIHEEFVLDDVLGKFSRP